MIEYPCDPDLAPKSPDPFEDKAEVVAGGCKNWVDGIALLISEIITVHSVPGFEVADHRFDG